MALIQVYHPIERKNIPVSKDNRAKCCVYGVIDLTGKGRDLVCGIPTKKFWDKDAECWDWKPFCPKHQAMAEEQDRKELEEES